MSFFALFSFHSFECGDNIRIQGGIGGLTEYNPCIIFDAPDYQNWCNEWDHTLNGLFPDMTQSQFINDMLEIDESDWLENQVCD